MSASDVSGTRTEVARPLRILVLYGTRPELIKMAPVVRELRRRPERFAMVLCTTAQHRDMLDQMQEAFGLRPRGGTDRGDARRLAAAGAGRRCDVILF